MQAHRNPSPGETDSVVAALLAPAAVLLALALGIGSAQWWSASPPPADPARNAATAPGATPVGPIPGNGFAAQAARSHRDATAAGGSGPVMPPARDTGASMR